MINVSDLLTLLANYGSTCDATGSGAGRSREDAIPLSRAYALCFVPLTHIR